MRQRKISRNCMTGRVLLLCAMLADERGEYVVQDVCKKLKKEYPDMTKLYATPLTQYVYMLITNGHTEATGIPGRHRLPFRTLDMMEACGFPMERLLSV